jgi:hypothetical protein
MDGRARPTAAARSGTPCPGSPDVSTRRRLADEYLSIQHWTAAPHGLRVRVTDTRRAPRETERTRDGQQLDADQGHTSPTR